MLQTGSSPYFLPRLEPVLNEAPPLSDSHAENDLPLNHAGNVPSFPLGTNLPFHQAHQGQAAQTQVTLPMVPHTQVLQSSAHVTSTSSQVDPALSSQVPISVPNIPYVVPTIPYKVENFLLPGSLPKDRLDNFFSESTGRAYNPLWWRVIGVDPSIFTTIKSVQKWSDFFNKVFAVGDRFVVDVFKNGTWQSKEAFVSNVYKG